MSELAKKVDKAIERICTFDPSKFRQSEYDSYYLAFSGGKDSVVVKRLMDMAGVAYDAHYRVTSVDPPELVRFIRERYPDVSMDKPRYPDKDTYGELRGRQVTMWNLIPRKLMPPTRLVRYCCQWLKEDGGDGRMTVTGVRWAESVNRKKNQGSVVITKPSKETKNNENFRQTPSGGIVLINDNNESRRVVESCYRRHRTTVNPIIDWTDSEVWEFIHAENISYCALYDEGYTRLGCVGCPMAGRHGREREFLRWPKYKRAYLAAFGRMLEERRRKGLANGTWQTATPEGIFHWWMNDDVLPEQMNLFEEARADDKASDTA